jgi:hypothetical protein
VPAVLLVVALSLTLVGAIGMTVWNQLERLSLDLPRHKGEIIHKIVTLREASKGSWLERVTSMFRDITEEVQQQVPYIGVWMAAALPLALGLAVFPGWTQPLLIVGLFVALELTVSNVVEPLLYGQSIGVSEVALLVAALFWTWLWGPVGLVLSAPLTACLAVLGRHMPQLAFLHVLLGDEPALPTYMAYYQRLLARDDDEASDLIEDYLKDHPPESLYDEVLVPALTLVRRNREQEELSQDDERFMLQATRENLDDVFSGDSTEASDTPSAKRVLVLGCPARDEIDELSLVMFQHLVDKGPCRLEIVSAKTLSAEVVGLVQRKQPALVLIAALPSDGLGHTRYLCKRLRSRFGELPILVGCWGLNQNVDRARTRLTAAGANHVALSLLDARDQFLPLVQVAAADAEARNLVQTA